MLSRYRSIFRRNHPSTTLNRSLSSSSSSASASSSSSSSASFSLSFPRLSAIPCSWHLRTFSSSSSLSSSSSSSPASSSSSSSSVSSSNDRWSFKQPTFQVACKCEAVKITGVGASSLNFVCHCSICRLASGLPFLGGVGFKREQIEFNIKQHQQQQQQQEHDKNHEGAAYIEKLKPNGSKNDRWYCSKCKDYIGEDATHTLGVISLPLHRSVSTPSSIYRPNFHIFYDFRSVNAVNDELPKWATLPDGKLHVHATANANAQQQQQQFTAVKLPATENWDNVTGALRSNVQPLSPTRSPEPAVYHFTERDPVPNHVSAITPEKVAERVSKKYAPSKQEEFVAPNDRTYDVIIVGGGHNGLVSAAYLSKAGYRVLVLERRHLVGGAAVTEELYPGFKFSRASYLAGLLRPSIIRDLALEEHGFKYLVRSPSSFTPTLPSSMYAGRYLMLGRSAAEDAASIAQFSERDAKAYVQYEEQLSVFREMLQPILDNPLPSLFSKNASGVEDVSSSWRTLRELVTTAWKHRSELPAFYELLTAPASQILDRWFESEMLKTTLATDAVIGASCSPKHAGSAYVLLHHVMGEAAGRKGVWAYVEGGMGALSNAIASSARAAGAEIVTNATVSSILHAPATDFVPARVTGVRLVDGTELKANIVLSNATPYHTFLELLPGLSRDSGLSESSPLPASFSHHIRYTDYSCGAFKINMAVSRLPSFLCYPTVNNEVGPQHTGTIHFETCMQEIEDAQREAAMGIPATRPVIEMTIPSSLDKTISPPGQHVVQLFVQFAPYDLDVKVGSWADPRFTRTFVERVLSVIEEHAPGFRESILFMDVLTPLDLERVFGLHRGNIMHGALSLNQLAYTRMPPGYHNHRTPLKGLYVCGAGAHPGGGVQGAAGKNCASVVIQDTRSDYETGRFNFSFFKRKSVIKRTE